MQVNRNKLIQCLDAVSPGLSAKDIIEQSSCYVFSDGRVMTFNDEVTCSIKSPLGKIEGAIPAKPLFDLLSKLTEDEIGVSVENKELRVSAKRRRAGITMETEILLPVKDVEVPADDDWKKLPSDFCDAIGIVHGCASKDESNFSLVCVHVHPDHVEACDNFQLARWPLTTGVESPSLVRASSIKHVAGLGVTELAETEAWLHFRNPMGLVISCRRCKEDFVELDKILKVSGVKAILPKDLAEVVEKAGIFRDEQNEGSVKVDLRPGRLRLRGESATGWYEERKQITYDGEPMTFTVSPEVLVEVIKQSRECEIAEGRLKVDTGKFVWVACLEEEKPKK